MDMSIVIWKKCRFWLRVIDGSSIRALGLIPKIVILNSGHTFQISAVFMELPHSNTNPLLFGAAVASSITDKGELAQECAHLPEGSKVRWDSNNGRAVAG